MIVMSLFQKLVDAGQRAVVSYTGDTVFLAGAAAATALVIAADKNIQESEIDKALSGMMSHKALSASFTAAKIEEVLNAAIERTKTRAGKIELQRELAKLSTRAPEHKQDIFLIAADVADDGGLADVEKAVLIDVVAHHLNLANPQSLLG